MVRTALIVLTAGTILSAAAYGQKAAPQNADADKSGPPSLRYRFSHTADGVMRLDSQTGEVTVCSPKDGAWICNSAPQKSAQLQTETGHKDGDLDTLTVQIAQLKSGQAALMAELAALKRQIADIGGQAITQEERRDLVSRIAMLEQDNSGLKGALARIEAQNADIKSKPTIAPAANDDLNSALAQQQQENAKLKDDLAALQDQVDSLTKNMASQDAAAAQRAQLDELATENAGLKEQLAALQDDAATMRQQIAALTPPPPPVPPAPVPAPKGQQLQLPSRAELDRAGAVLADAWRRVVEMIDNLRKDMTRKDDPPVRL